MTGRHIAIVGAGFTGTTLAVQLLERLRRPATITLVDARGLFGPGLAYGTNAPSHLMNTPASAVGARAGQSGHFVAWRSVQADLPSQVRDATFPSRSLYGRYLFDLLNEAAHLSDIALARVTAEVIGLSREGDGFALRLASGSILRADKVALCTGYGPPRPSGDGRIVLDPWGSDWIERVRPDDAVLLRGTGLTMIDQVVHLAASGHAGPILAVSRRGLLPHVQRDQPATPQPPMTPRPAGLGNLTRWLRAAARDQISGGGDWRAVVDAVRPQAQHIWQELSQVERARFRRHLRPYWDIHRHRMPPDAGRILAPLLANGQLQVCAGGLHGAVDEGETVRITFRSRRLQSAKLLRTNWLVDCASLERGAGQGPLPWSLLSLDLATHTGDDIVPRIAHDGRFMRTDGTPERGLFGLGPVTRSALWEITAIPEIREQCHVVAQRLSVNDVG